MAFLTSILIVSLITSLVFVVAAVTRENRPLRFAAYGVIALLALSCLL